MFSESGYSLISSQLYPSRSAMVIRCRYAMRPCAQSLAAPTFIATGSFSAYSVWEMDVMGKLLLSALPSVLSLSIVTVQVSSATSRTSVICGRM